MRMVAIIVLAFALVLPGNAQTGKPAKSKPAPQQQKQADKKVILKTVRDKLTYVIGYDVALKMVADIQQKKLDLDSKIFLMAVNDAFEGKKPILSDAEARNVMALFEQLMKATPEEREKLQKQLFSGK